MAQMSFEAGATRYGAITGPTIGRPARHFEPRAHDLFRGLVFGLPIGLALWIVLALIVWKLV